MNEESLVLTSLEITSFLMLDLHEPLVIPVRNEEGIFVAEYPLLEMYEWADNREELLTEVKLCLSFLYLNYTPTPDQDLTPEAIRLKKNLLALGTKRVIE